MPFDALAEGLFHFIGRAILHFLVEILFEVVFYFIGMAFLRCVTFGRYPPRNDRPYSEGFVSVVGLLVLASIIVGAILFLKTYM